MNKKTAAYIMIIVSMLIWGSLSIFVKSLNTDFSSAEIVLGRILLGMLTLGIAYAVSGNRTPGPVLKRNMLKLLLSGAAMGINWTALFEAYRWVDVSISTLCYYTAPIFVVLASLLIFRDRFSLRKLIGVAAAAAGTFIVTGAVMGGADPVRGVLLGLLAAVMYASVTLSTRLLKEVSGLEITFFRLIGSLCIVAPYALLTHTGPWHVPSLLQAGSWIALGTIHTGVALLFYFSSMKTLPVQSAALLSYIDPLSALGFAAVCFGERMSALQWVGAALILGGAILGETEIRRRSRADS